MRYPAHLLLKEIDRNGKPYFYLCKCGVQKDINSYRGSGKVWLAVLKKYGGPIKTTVLGTYDDHESFKEAGSYYSSLFDVVNNPSFANLVPELGDGGWINDQTGKRWKVKDSSKMGRAKFPPMTDDLRKRHSDRMSTNNPMRDADVAAKMASTRQSRGNYKTSVGNRSAVPLCLTFDDGTCIIGTGRDLSKVVGVSAGQISTLINNPDKQRTQIKMINDLVNGKSKRRPSCNGYVIRKLEEVVSDQVH